MQKKITCPCCGYKVLSEKAPGMYNICPICFWEDDPDQFEDPDFDDAANKVSLRQAQKNFLKYGASKKEFIGHVRKPMKSDNKDPKWKPLPVKK
jgi:hypothetical protein